MSLDITRLKIKTVLSFGLRGVDNGYTVLLREIFFIISIHMHSASTVKRAELAVKNDA